VRLEAICLIDEPILLSLEPKRFNDEALRLSVVSKPDKLVRFWFKLEVNLLSIVRFCFSLDSSCLSSESFCFKLEPICFIIEAKRLNDEAPKLSLVRFLKHRWTALTYIRFLQFRS
jgi:hypothetical protein